FDESGLPAGTAWGVTLNGSLLASSSASINFTEDNGSFAFEVESVQGYTANPSNGSVDVKGTAVTQSITFQVARTTPPANGSSSPKILGLPPIEAYALIGGIALAVLLGLVALMLIRRRKKAVTNAGPPTEPTAGSTPPVPPPPPPPPPPP
ncbi:MAG: hypothetical protein WAN87_08820, partial [Thermoplasmata archaeon]